MHQYLGADQVPGLQDLLLRKLNLSAKRHGCQELGTVNKIHWSRC